MPMNKLREKRGHAVAEMRRINDAAEGRALTTEEDAQYAKAFNAAQEAKAEMDRRLQVEDLEREAASSAAPNGADRTDAPTSARMAAFNSYLALGREAGPEVMAALQNDSATSGGNLVAPMQWMDQLIQELNDAVLVRQHATVETVTSADSLGAPSLDTDVSDPEWTGEISAAAEDSSITIGRREWKPQPLAKLVKISRKLLRNTSGRAEALVRERLAYKFGIVEENAFWNGSGAAQPLGMMVASNMGISTARDVSTGNSQTAFTADGLKEAFYSVKKQYRDAASFGSFFPRAGIKMLSKLKDGDGQYLWHMSLTEGEPDRLFGRPNYESEYLPNTFTTGLYVGLFGDLSYYWIADALTMEIQRLDELYARTGQVGFIGRKETDAMPVLESAFARVKLA